MVYNFAQAQEIWHIKAVDPAGKLLDVKAFDQSGNMYDVKAIGETGGHQYMDIKAIRQGMKYPLKIMVSIDIFAPVKAIGAKGEILDIKAITADGRKLDVKGVSRAGNLYHIKAVSDDGEFYGIKALSPEGLLEDVKGIKYSDQAIEGTVNGTSFAAHVKAIPQSQDCITDFLWHVKAVHPDGKLIDIKAIDENGRIYDVKALAENGNGHIMDIKAFVGSTKLTGKDSSFNRQIRTTESDRTGWKNL
ncbi:MAG: hypothetical protein IPO72_11760 [Saprospiraceae bacterium]|nr:hypothetical protein [Candidatus Vicinibacter affinis]